MASTNASALTSHPLILAIDQGTTGTKVLVVDSDLKVLSEASVPFPQHFPTPGWVEHDPEELWDSVVKAIGKALARVDVKKIVAIGITNQRETICFWEKGTSQSLSHAIVWQDRRTSDYCDHLRSKGVEGFFAENTGLLLDPYFSGTKVHWALKNWQVVSSAHKEGRLAVGTVDSFLIAKLTDGQVHATEPSNASRTLAFHLTRHKWDSDLCSGLGIPLDIWPEVRPSTGKFGFTKGVPGLPDGIPITGVLGDQQSALLGQACIEEGMAKCTYGTGTFMLVNTGKQPSKSRNRLVSTIAWALSESDVTYALEGSAFIAGAAIQWARDGLKFFEKSADIEAIAESVPSSDGVVFVPSLTGMGAPYWNAEATGMFTGITRGTTRAHMCRAILEGVAFQNADILNAMQKDMGKPLRFLNVDGGACRNNLLMQIQSDLLGIELRRPVIQETTSLGAVFAAGLGIGLWRNLEEIRSSWKQERFFEPKITEKERDRLMKSWHSAVERTLITPKGKLTQ